ncbi:hypothetical protein ACTXG7_16145 [Mycolicibacterium sp. Dal123E01]|uniref:hypothetical protein n=1 Tax=Mycolicibacterium sp. Dal123E01 TaxID=3457578 RepID=UPI00403EB403
MTVSAIAVVSVILQIILLAVDKWLMPKAQPSKFQEPIVFVVGSATIAATTLNIPFYHYLMASNLWVVGGALLALAIAPPVIGVIEARVRRNPDVYATDRFNEHLRNNFVGFVATLLFILAARWTTGFDDFTVQFKNESAFNIVLPLTVVTIFAFVRWQQDKADEDLDARMERKDPDWERKIAGFSLRYVNQLANVLYLIVVTFTAAGTILYMFSYTLNQAKNNSPLSLSLPLALAMVGVLGFLIVCGLPSMKKFQAVYLNFLTGTPAALMVIVVWIALLKESHLRNYFALGVVVIGYATYSLLVIIGNRGLARAKLQLHYYSSMAFAVALTLLVGALYVS